MSFIWRTTHPMVRRQRYLDKLEAMKTPAQKKAERDFKLFLLYAWAVCTFIAALIAAVARP